MRHALIRQKTSVAFSVQTVAVLTSAAVLCSSALAQDTASEPASAPSETVAPENAVAQDADAQPSDEKTLSAKAAEATKKAAQAATEITDKVVDTVKTAIEKARAETVSNDGTAGTTTQATASSDQPVSDKAKASDDGGPDNQKSVATAAADPGQESVSGTEPSEIVGVSQAVIDDYDTNLEPLFKYFHSNPELSFRETKTASRLAAELGALGYQVTQGVGETGVVAVLENGEGPTVMLRADMDGLPIEERSGLEYASKVTQQDIDGVVKPVMHACGHDVHITSLVGAARQLAARKSEWSGTLVLIGQPAEERIDGARKMLEDGLYERFPKPDYALAFHVASNLPAGTIEIVDGLVSSSSDSVNISVYGVGAHGASPHNGLDPILISSHIVVALQSIVSRNINPLDPGVITVGSIHGGFKHNIIPDQVDLELTVRSNSPEVRAELLAGIERTVKGVAQGLGVPDEMLPLVEYGFESTPTVINDAPTAQRVRAAFKEQFGSENLVNPPPEGMGAEDFAYFVQPELGVKGVYFSVGGTPATELKTAAGHHSPFFKIVPRPSVTVGTTAMTKAAITLFDTPQTSLGNSGQ